MARYSDRVSFPDSSQLRAIVLASSRAEVLKALTKAGFRATMGYLRSHWCETRNDTSLETARNAGRGVVLVRDVNDYWGPFLKA